MTSIRTQSRIKSDGRLDLQLETALPEGEVEVVVVIQPINGQSKNADWIKFVRETAGSFADDPIVEPPELGYETREPFP